ncbi:hypothetical protein K7X08_007685 [Anisodus acutangulus]|uniref:Cobalamin-independent methionine synthase MetE C-terminal/archaeal domain-containing protein n=1 Tax=Anisodus acutangulus TaxID=402998 RepID=A0A9Q1QZQ2_9SOLA|nr:hypothetical protein K7X08_007685 [Anisodus acutangulus]
MVAFFAQKVVEVNALAKALSGAKDEAFFSANAAAQASRKSSPRVTNETVQKARNDMVEYFGEQLSGFAFTANGWVQSYGSRCVKPPIIYGDVSRPNPMTVFWSSTAQSMTKRPMKGMLTGPVTILNWSFVRNDQPREVISELKAAGASWIQFDEPTLVLDLEAHQLEAFTKAYLWWNHLYLALMFSLSLTLLMFLLTLDLIKGSFPSGKYLFAGVVDGRNIWANDLAASLNLLQSLEDLVGKDKLVVSTSCSLLHTAVDLINEPKLDDEIKSWLAFAAQKVVEVNALAKALSGAKDESAALQGSDHRRATNVSARLDAQQKKLNLPVLPTTTIGSFLAVELRRVRREYKAKKISEEEYVKSIKEEIKKVVDLQEELDIDVLVHGEPERNDMVEYFGEQLYGFAFLANGWVQ